MSAIFSPCRTWRYRLDREFLRSGPTIVFGLHNPSTADENTDDPTLKRGIAFAHAWGAGRLVFVNSWAGVATKQKDLWLMDDPIGPQNDLHIIQVAREVRKTNGFFVFAWGRINPPQYLRRVAISRLYKFENLVRSQGCEIRILGLTKAGYPRHPLYLKADTEPTIWPMED